MSKLNRKEHIKQMDGRNSHGIMANVLDGFGVKLPKKIDMLLNQTKNGSIGYVCKYIRIGMLKGREEFSWVSTHQGPILALLYPWYTRCLQ